MIFNKVSKCSHQWGHLLYCAFVMRPNGGDFFVRISRHFAVQYGYKVLG